MLPVTAFHLLRGNPAAFLNSHSLRIAGPAVTGATQYCFGHGDVGAWAAFGPGAPNESFYMSAAAHGGVGIVENVATGRITVGVYGVHMIGQNVGVNLAALPHGLLTAITPDVMVTGQLSGCTMAFRREANGHVRVMHIQPGGVRNNAVFVQAQISLAGRMNGGVPTHVYGPLDYGHPENRATVIGFRRNGVWEIYGQAFSVMGQRRIVEVTQIL